MEPVKIFIDTNIVLDYFTGRMGDGQAKTIVQIGQDPKFALCISILTAINVLYLAENSLRLCNLPTLQSYSTYSLRIISNTVMHRL